MIVLGLSLGKERKDLNPVNIATPGKRSLLLDKILYRCVNVKFINTIF